MRALLALAVIALVCRAGDPVPVADVVRDGSGRIVEVSLARTWATDRDLEWIAGLKDLKRLDLSLTYVSDRGIERLSKLEDLEELNLDTAEGITDAAIAFLRVNHKLRKLNLRGTDVTDTGLEYLATLTGLTLLNIAETQVTDIGLENLASLDQLEELDLGGNKISGVGLDVLKLLPKLKRLSFHGIQRRNAGVCWAPVVTDAEMDTIALLTGLEELNVGWGIGLGLPDPMAASRPLSEMDCHLNGGIRVTDLGVAKLANLKRLRRLDLSGSAVTPAGLKSLRALPRLERLSVWNARALDDSAGAALRELRALTTLDVSNTEVGDGTMRALVTLPGLQHLYLTDTGVTDAGLAEFRRRLPGCTVSWATRPKGAQ
jgi:Leucine-rich repeat (LRR) protein